MSQAVFTKPSFMPLSTVASVLVLTSTCALALHDEHKEMEQVLVTSKAIPVVASASGDAAAVLGKHGVDFASAGGVSSLPILRGFNDDRIKLVVDGAEITSACANHMNPALSYMDASRISEVEVIAGITPVSQGGDSIAGTIAVNSAEPHYAEMPDALSSTGSAGYFYRGNQRRDGFSANYTLASDWWSLNYSGSLDKSESYRDGNGDKVLDTLYRAENHAITGAVRDEHQQLVVKYTRQEIPYQGFPNQYMDMVDNRSDGLNINYQRDFAWGVLDTRITWQEVDHEMGFFTDEKPGTMPMITEGRDLGYAIRLELPLSDAHTLRIGHEYHSFDLDDYWPAVPGHPMMGPQDYVNINGGERDRVGLYAESDYHWTEQWSTLVGVRLEQVRTDTNDVQPYNTMMMNPDVAAALAFNSTSHKRKDDNVDITLLARYQASASTTYEIGYARKTRSPNLYERYSWGQSPMATMMIGWFGDGNGYVGNMDLEPEIAHTLSATMRLQDSTAEQWQLSVTPWFTRVDDFIDVEQIGTFNPRMAMNVTRPKLQFINLDAELYGVDIQGNAALWDNARWGRGSVNGLLAYTRGERTDSGDDLYHIMPLQLRFGLRHELANWSSMLEVQLVDSKDNVDPVRLEHETSGYALVNLETAYNWNQVRVTLGVSNLFDRQYDLPLGGVNIAGWRAGGQVDQFEALPGQGRSVDVGISYSF